MADGPMQKKCFKILILHTFQFSFINFVQVLKVSRPFLKNDVTDSVMVIEKSLKLSLKNEFVLSDYFDARLLKPSERN